MVIINKIIIVMRKKHAKIIEDADADLRKMFGGRIKIFRTRADISAKVLASRIGISRGALTQIETGRNNVSMVQIWKIACVLKCDIADFFPSVPDSISLLKSDLEKIAKENEKAAEYMKNAYKI